jgi:arylsulfatase A-like enzyme
VPLIVSVPGLTRAGTKCDQTVSLIDLYPNLVDLAGFDKPPHLDERAPDRQRSGLSGIPSPVFLKATRADRLGRSLLKRSL